MKKRLSMLAFIAGAVAVSIIVLGPPLDRLADRSFTWHMLQHLMLLYVVGALIVAARPFELFSAVAGKQRIARFVTASRPLHALAAPPVALFVFVSTLWMTHFSALYEGSLEHAALHVAEHALYLGAGTVFWLPVLAPPPLRPLSYPARLLYLAVALPQGALLGMAIGTAASPLYPHYAAQLRSAALQDQHGAAALMWIGGGMTVFTAFLLTLASWARREACAEPSAT